MSPHSRQLLAEREGLRARLLAELRLEGEAQGRVAAAMAEDGFRRDLEALRRGLEEVLGSASPARARAPARATHKIEHALAHSHTQLRASVHMRRYVHREKHLRPRP